MAISTDHQMEKFKEKILQVMGPLSQHWKGLGDARNESSARRSDILKTKDKTLLKQRHY